MWFLGAGSSAAAGIPTALDMVWEFKQQLYISQRKASPKMVSDLGNATVRALLQAHIDGAERYPPAGAPDEYATLFEAVWPNEQDRRSYLDSKVSGAKPSYGHLALATLMHAKLAKIVWSTNFDPLVADACAKVFGSTGALTVAALDGPWLAAEAVNAERWPVEIKLHGDFRSRRLKNTNDELRQQDARLRQLMVDCCGRYGLVVAGYSGRDDSIMDTLLSALESESAFPAGVFWLHRGDDEPLPRVLQFLAAAKEAGVDGGLVRIENFDEVMRDLIRLKPDIDTTVLDEFAAARRRWTPAPRPAGQSSWPVLRLNALPLVQKPSVCRRVVCNIGGYREITAAFEAAGTDILFARVKSGILAFGDDTDVQRTFAPFHISEFDLHTIEERRLRHESGERGLLRVALSRAIARHRGLRFSRQRSADLMTPLEPSDERWEGLRRVVGQLSGDVFDVPGLAWCEGISTRLDWADDRVWLLFEPRIVFDGLTDSNRAAAADFGRERSVKRYNRVLNDLIEFWARTLASDGSSIAALGCTTGVDAVFTLSAQTAFSRRARP